VFNYSLRRLLISIPVLIAASFVSFVAVRGTFDACARLRFGQGGTERYTACRVRLGLDENIVSQWWNWLTDFLTGDWGTSSRTNEDVSTMVWRAFGNTLQLIFWAVVISAAIAIFVGVISSVRQYSLFDYGFTGLAYLGLAMPPFWFALVAMQVTVSLKERTGSSEPILYFVGLHGPGQSGINGDYFRHLLLPVLTLTVQIIASWSRFQRASMLEVLGSDYVRTARSKGLRERRVVVRHALRNALIPLVTVMALDAGALFGGLIITETLFAIPGMGRLFYDALLAGDTNVVMAWLVVAATFVVVFNLLADLAYSVLDPRIRLS
jgi:peptide/nickel transport system permease protein